MKNTIEAIKYGIDTLKVSPEEMFDLIESSNGYEGDDYRRWLANEIIHIAEKEDVGFSQLLVKKFSTISTIMEGLDEVIKQEWIDEFKKRLGTDNIVSVNFPELGTVMEDVSWFEGVDSLAETPFKDSFGAFDFTQNYAFIARLESEPCSKSSELAKLAKDWGIICKNEGSLLLYRMCNFIEMSNIGSEFKFAFLANTNFLCDSDNAGIINYFLQYFNYTGFVIKSVDLMTDSYSKGEYVFCVCSPREKDCQDGFVLDKAVMTERGLAFCRSVKRYSRSKVSMLSALSNARRTNEDVLGWLNVPTSQVMNCTVSYEKDALVDLNIPIVESNLKKVIVYYSVVHSLGSGGMSTNITRVMSGSSEYDNLVYNCLPLFLFNTHSTFADYSENAVFSINSPFMKKMLEDGEVYFSYESKDLLEICKGFLSFLGDSAQGLTFEGVRKEANHSDLNSSYVSALLNIKDYIRSVYRKVE